MTGERAALNSNHIAGGTNALRVDINKASELHLIGSTNILHKGVVWAV